jgi:hypothetical protein
MSDDRLELIDEYMKAKAAFDKASAWLDTVKDQLRPMGTWSEGGVTCDVSVIERETISLKDLTKLHPELIRPLREEGIIKTTSSERLTVKVREEK